MAPPTLRTREAKLSSLLELPRLTWQGSGEEEEGGARKNDLLAEWISSRMSLHP